MMENETHVGRVLPRHGACLICKQQKKKCDGLRPACFTCKRLGRASECEYKANPPPKRYHPPPKKSKALLDIGPSLEVLAFDKSADWWKLNELPVVLTDFLMATFVQHALQSHFTSLMPDLLHRLARYPPSHPSYPHPSLMNSIYLLSTFFLSSPSHPSRIQRQLKWNAHEAGNALLERVRMAMIEDVMVFNGQGEEVLDLILALGLVGRYFYYTGRYALGHHEGSVALRLAISCGLNHITPVGSSSSDEYLSSILPPPKDEADTLYRMDTFWHAFMMDRGGSVCSNLEISVLDDDVTTPFSPSAVTSQSVDSDECYSVTSVVEVGSPVPNISHDDPHTIKAKASTIFEKVRRFSRNALHEGAKTLSDLSPALLDEYYALDNAIMRFTESVPPPPHSPSSSRAKFEATYADLAMLRTGGQMLLIRLNAPFCADSEDCRTKSLAAARDIVSIGIDLEKTASVVYWELPINMGWINASEIFQLETRRILESDGGVMTLEKEWMVLDIRSNMEYLVRITRRFLKLYRAHQGSLDFIEEVLSRDAGAIEKLTHAKVLQESWDWAPEDDLANHPLWGALAGGPHAH